MLFISQVKELLFIRKVMSYHFGSERLGNLPSPCVPSGHAHDAIARHFFLGPEGVWHREAVF